MPPTLDPLDPVRSRIQSVDLLRGLVMVIMALDHVRTFMGATPFAPEDPTQTTVLLFFTRWITHFCAPVFVFLAGTSAFLYARNTRCNTKKLRNFLLTRGLWIIFVEIFLLNLVVQFLPYQALLLQVLWVIGWSMIILAGLLYLPRYLILSFGLVMIFGHNLMDYMGPGLADGWLFILLHKQQLLVSSPLPVIVYYPLLPWPGIMALGYLFGRFLVLPTPNRNNRIWTFGLTMIVLFLVLRLINAYGDPVPWTVQERGPVFTFLSFLNTEKYPASLLFVLMTLGPSILVMPWLEKWQGQKVRYLSVFGKVPFFFYLVHFFFVHVIAIIWSQWKFGVSEWWLGPPQGFPPQYSLNLYLVLAVWILIIIICYPVCLWYANFKRAHKEHWWLSYL